jgi:uncharacterized protein
MKRTLQYLRGPLVVLVVAIILLFGVVVYQQIAHQRSSGTTLYIGGRSYSLEVANTNQERELGLGKRASMPANQGMLFVFGQSTPECFWMKDMHFSLDMIWLSADKQIVHIEQNVSPNTYPQTFCPNEPAKYVIELNAGTAATTDMQAGETLDF